MTGTAVVWWLGAAAAAAQPSTDLQDDAAARLPRIQELVDRAVPPATLDASWTELLALDACELAPSGDGPTPFWAHAETVRGDLPKSLAIARMASMCASPDRGELEDAWWRVQRALPNDPRLHLLVSFEVALLQARAGWSEELEASLHELAIAVEQTEDLRRGNRGRPGPARWPRVRSELSDWSTALADARPSCDTWSLGLALDTPESLDPARLTTLAGALDLGASADRGGIWQAATQRAARTTCESTFRHPAAEDATEAALVRAVVTVDAQDEPAARAAAELALASDWLASRNGPAAVRPGVAGIVAAQVAAGLAATSGDLSWSTRSRTALRDSLATAAALRGRGAPVRPALQERLDTLAEQAPWGACEAIEVGAERAARDAGAGRALVQAAVDRTRMSLLGPRAVELDFADGVRLLEFACAESPEGARPVLARVPVLVDDDADLTRPDAPVDAPVELLETVPYAPAASPDADPLGPYALSLLRHARDMVPRLITVTPPPAEMRAFFAWPAHDPDGLERLRFLVNEKLRDALGWIFANQERVSIDFSDQRWESSDDGLHIAELRVVAEGLHNYVMVEHAGGREVRHAYQTIEFWVEFRVDEGRYIEVNIPDGATRVFYGRGLPPGIVHALDKDPVPDEEAARAVAQRVTARMLEGLKRVVASVFELREPPP